MSASARIDVITRHLTAGPSAEGIIFDRAPSIASKQEWDRAYRSSVETPAAFWGEEARENFVWKNWPAGEAKCGYNFDVRAGPVHIEWFRGATTNVCYNALDAWWRLPGGRAGQPAIIWEGNDEGGGVRRVTYGELLTETCRVANWLRAVGVRRGDVVTIYMGMVPEIIVAMLACARIGAVHSVVFGGFSAEALGQRISDARSRVLITASGIARGARALVRLKAIADEAMELAAGDGCAVRTCLVLEDASVPLRGCVMRPGRDVAWGAAIPGQPPTCEPAWMEANEPLFALYTSGSTGKPKGLVHAGGGYMVGAAAMMRTVFDLRPGDVHFCTADAGWITGHTAVTYGPLLVGATLLLLGGPPSHPDPGRCWRMVARHKARTFYTAPTAVRALLAAGNAWLEGQEADRSSLRVLGVAGEPIGEHAFGWYRDAVGRGRCAVVDTWWQTETGAATLSPLPSRWAQGDNGEGAPAGCACGPCLGASPTLLDPATGREMQGEGSGVLVLRRPTPSMARTILGDHGRFEATYFATYPGYYLTGDGARRDGSGRYWLTGRTDDVINVAGHRIGTAEVEGALSSHPAVAEAAVIGVPHAVKGTALYAFVTTIAHTRTASGPPQPPAPDAATLHSSSSGGAAPSNTQSASASDGSGSGGAGSAPGGSSTAGSAPGPGPLQPPGPGLRAELVEHVRRVIGPFAAPDYVHWAPALPKTRSGKIMRRVLRKVAEGSTRDLGDVSTLADPGVVDVLLALKHSA